MELHFYEEKIRGLENGTMGIYFYSGTNCFYFVFSIAGAVILQRNIIQPIQKMVVAMNVPEKELVGVRLSIDQED